MAIERTLSLIKPNAVARNLVGSIAKTIEDGGLRIVAMRMLRLSEAQAKAFYTVHRERPFFSSLTAFMSSGPIVAMTLEGDGAIARYREIMGATNPAKAAPGTIRAQWGEDMERNAVHGSDAPETARDEVAFFFPRSDLP